MSGAIEILKSLGAVITDDHFVYTSGKHGEIYINKDTLYPHTNETSQIGKLFAEKYKDMEIDVVAGPALGGIILSQWTAYHLSQIKSKEVLGVYTDKTPEGDQIFKRGYDKLINGKNILIVEDLTTTGGSVKKVVNAAKAVGTNVVAVCVMVNRDPNITSDTVGAPFDSLGVLQAGSWDEEELPEHIKTRPVNQNIGHGKKYLQEKGLL
jgi:orotate phosphoribosyltransferase